LDKTLTLSLDKAIIESAKNYAKSNNISLSKLIESYLTTHAKRKRTSTKITPLVESLSGIINLDEDFDIEILIPITLLRNTINRLLIDTNIVIDLLSKRDNFYDEAANLFSRADQNRIGINYFTFNICKYKLYSFKTKISKRSEGNIEEI